MLIDLKYHLVSLIAVFLALAIGIMIGSSLVSGASAERRITQRLEKEFSKLRMQNQQQHVSLQNMQSILEKHNKFESVLMPNLIKSRIKNYKVALIQTGDYNAATENIKSTLELSGAHVSCIIKLDNNIFTEKNHDNLSQIVTSITGDTHVPDPKERILQIISNCVVKGSNVNAMDVLASKGIIKMSDSGGSRTIRVVIIGGSKYEDAYRADEIDVILIQKLKDAGAFRIVGTELLNVESSYIPAYQSQDISTVDNIDEPMGLISLVYILSGDSGNFGVKKTADKVAPVYLEEHGWQR